MKEEWLTQKQAAEVAGVTTRTVRRWFDDPNTRPKLKTRKVRRGRTRRVEYLRSSIVKFAAKTVILTDE